MEWEELLEKISKNISYWSFYVCVRTSLEKEDVSQELLLMIWETYCNKKKEGKEITKAYAQYRLAFGVKRIIKNFYSDNETKLNKVSIEEVILDDLRLAYFDSPYYLRRNYLRAKAVSLVEEKCYSSHSAFRCIRILDLLLEGRTNKEAAWVMNCSESCISMIVNRKIKPLIRKKL